MTAPPDARALLAEALGMRPAELPAEARIGSVEQWDSLAHARLLIALETALARTLDTDEILAIESLADIAALLDRRP